MAESFPLEIVSREALDRRLRSLMRTYDVVGPVTSRGQTHFSVIHEVADIDWGYSSTVIPPSKVIYQAEQPIVGFVRRGDSYAIQELDPLNRRRLLLGVHPCDLHGMLVLERTLLGKWRDDRYAVQRERTLVVGLNCQKPGPECFCSSFGTGPFYARWMGQGPPEGCDILLTELSSGFLAQVFTEAGRQLLGNAEQNASLHLHEEEKRERHQRAMALVSKNLNTNGLGALLLRHQEHSVWERVGEGRCLSCANCTMVCPTCYCYDVVDRPTLDLKTILRWRRWDSCQDRHFAEVHFENFRATRRARLRQFVCHKLSYWIEQYGCYGCVGCGRCIRWCPTGIDLTEIAAEIRLTEAST